MSMDASFETDAQLAEGGQPGMCAFHDPAMASEPVVAFDSSASDSILDASAPEMLPTARKVVALVRMQLARPAAWPAALSSHIGQGIDQLLEDHRVVPVGAGDAEHQRDALAVRDEVALAAEFAPVGRVGPVCEPPGGWGRWQRPGWPG